MYRNFIFGNASEALPHLLHAVMHGEEVGSRAGRVKELTHVGITLERPWQREILVPGRNPNLAAQIFETMWVLAGRDDMASLTQYLPRAADFSDDGLTWRAGYGARLRKWGNGDQTRFGEDLTFTDQLAAVIDRLKANPLDRQAVMSIWDPAIDNTPSKDIPCNNWLSFSSRLGKLDLHVAIRSNDAIWGWSGINAFEWSALQEIVAGMLGLAVGGLHFSTTSFHVYDRHWNKADRLSEMTDGGGFYGDSPRFDNVFAQGDLRRLDNLFESWHTIEEQIREGSIPRVEAERAVNAFPEPMLQSWLRVIQWWWTGDRGYLQPLAGTRLQLAATDRSVQPPDRAKPEPRKSVDPLSDMRFSDFVRETVKLHDEKHAAYGDSWKRRGEMLGIMANIARKVDRLGGAETADETSADTAADLFVYLAKYAGWLLPGGPEDTTTSRANAIMFDVDALYPGALPEEEYSPNGSILAQQEQWLRDQFEKLEEVVVEARAQGEDQRAAQVTGMLKVAYRLARRRWEDVNPQQYRGAVDPSEARELLRRHRGVVQS